MVFNKLLFSFRTAILGDGGDGVSFLWNFWWVKKSMLELVQNPFYSDFMFYPNMMDLHLHTLILGPALMVLPIQIFFGPVIALNVYVFLSFILSGIGAYMLIKLFVRQKYIAFFGGIIFSFNTYVISHAYGHFNLITTWPIPFIIYFLENLYNTKKTKYAIYSSMLYVFLIYSDLQYAIFTFMLILVWIAWKVVNDFYHKKDCLFLFRPLVLFVALILLGSIPYLTTVKSGFEKNLSKPDQIAVEFYSPQNILSYVIPPQGTIINQQISKYNEELAKLSTNTPEWATYLGISVIILLPFIFLKLIAKREDYYLFWLFVFLVFLILSFGPKINISQALVFVSPLKNIYTFPIIDMTRVPIRMLIISILALSILVSIVLSQINNHKKRFMIVLMLFTLYLFEIFSLPISVQKLEIPQAYLFLESQKNNQEDESIIEFPLFFTDRMNILGEKHNNILYYQTIHEYKMMNGYISYTPPGFLKNYINIPGILFLIEPSGYKTPENEDLDELKNYLFDKGQLKYAILHKKYLTEYDRNCFYAFIENDLSGEIKYNDSEIVIYEVSK